MTTLGILFDLDGTVADTAPDMVAALNVLLTRHNRPTIDYKLARTQVSHGVKGMLKLGFSLEPEHSDYPLLAKDYLAIYQEMNHANSRLFPGMKSLITKCQQQQIALGIVTNKPRYLAEPLLRVLEVDQDFSCLNCGDDIPERKPDPKPLFNACDTLQVSANMCIYVGDALRDIEAGKNAGMKTILVSWGYFDAKVDNIQDWEADFLVDNCEQILSILAH